MNDEREHPTGFPEPPGPDPGDHSGDDEPHHALTEEDGDRDLHEPDPRQDPEGKPPERDKLDD